jgi:post-segregation antitoxin (ccd killing protein)
MARINVYLPDPLAEAVRASDINLSRLTQVAAERELARRKVEAWRDRVLIERAQGVLHDAALEAWRGPTGRAAPEAPV